MPFDKRPETNDYNPPLYFTKITLPKDAILALEDIAKDEKTGILSLENNTNTTKNIQELLVHKFGFRLEVDFAHVVTVVGSYRDGTVSPGAMNGHVVLDVLRGIGIIFKR